MATMQAWATGQLILKWAIVLEKKFKVIILGKPFKKPHRLLFTQDWSLTWLRSALILVRNKLIDQRCSSLVHYMPPFDLIFFSDRGHLELPYARPLKKSKIKPRVTWREFDYYFLTQNWTHSFTLGEETELKL